MWENESMMIRDQLNISKDWMPLTAGCSEVEARSRFRGLPYLPRVLDVVNVAEAYRLKSNIPADNFFVNFSQNVRRRPWGIGMHCLSTTSETFDFGRQTVLTACDRLALMGMPAKHIAEVVAPKLGVKGCISERDMERLSGQGMCCPCLAVVQTAVFLNQHSCWFKQPEARTKRQKRA
jgi:hypothetical protein